ncbi:hypothetical protein MnTg04_01552 [bacterium MnTg04]|nr:hypothetical protein MnTg04_01552 [bacterium MnTg04]
MLGDRCRHLALDGEKGLGGQRAVIGLGPDVLIGACIDQLHIDAHLVAGALYAAFQDGRHTQFLADGFHVLGRVAIFHDRGT